MNIPNGFILFISGVPGVGKTTVSYELLKKYNAFRIVEETDILRDALRGYSEMLVQKHGQQFESIIGEELIYDHTKLLSLSDAKKQCQIMSSAINNVVMRQKRKGIPTIINGVHIVPEILINLLQHSEVVFVNLYVNEETAIYERILNRDPSSYMLNEIHFIYSSNQELFWSTEEVRRVYPQKIHNIDVTELSVTETLQKIMSCIDISLCNSL